MVNTSMHKNVIKLVCYQTKIPKLLLSMGFLRIVPGNSIKDKRVRWRDGKFNVCGWDSDSMFASCLTESPRRILVNLICAE